MKYKTLERSRAGPASAKYTQELRLNYVHIHLPTRIHRLSSLNIEVYGKTEFTTIRRTHRP